MFLSRVLLYSPFQLPKNSANKNVGSGNYVISFVTDKHFWLVGIGQRELEGIQQYTERAKPQAQSFLPYMGLLFVISVQ
jgi:hypothetical protein